MSNTLITPALAKLLVNLRRQSSGVPLDTENMERALRRAMALKSLPKGTPVQKIREALRKAELKQTFYVHLPNTLGLNPHPDDALIEVRTRCASQQARAKAGQSELARIYLSMLAEDIEQTFAPNRVLCAGLRQVVAGAEKKISALGESSIRPPTEVPPKGSAPKASADNRATPRELSERELMVLIPRLLDLDSGKRSMPTHLQVFKLYVLERLSSTAPEVRARKWAEATIRKRKRTIETNIFRPLGIRQPLERLYGSPAVFDNARKQEEAARKRNARIYRDDEN